MSQIVGWLPLTHTQRWHAHRRSAGAGHLAQGRFKSFPVEENEHLYTVARYVERNARLANLARRAEAWGWVSLYRWLRGSAEDARLLSPWPVPRQAGWVEHVNDALTEAELTARRRSVERGSPYGSETWCDRAIEAPDLHSTTPPRPTPEKRFLTPFISFIFLLFSDTFKFSEKSSGRSSPD